MKKYVYGLMRTSSSTYSDENLETYLPVIVLMINKTDLSYIDLFLANFMAIYFFLDVEVNPLNKISFS